MNLSTDFKILNISTIINTANQNIKDLNLNYSENKINYNFYKYKLYIFNKILELINLDNKKIKFEIIEISDNYYINENYLKIFDLHHLYIENIKTIFFKFLDNLNTIVNYISNNTKEYNKLDYKLIFYNNEIIKVINLKELNFDDDILVKLIQSNNFNEDLLKHCNVFNINQIQYYKDLFEYIDFKIIKYSNNLNHDIQILEYSNKELNEKIKYLCKENIEYNNNLNNQIKILELSNKELNEKIKNLTKENKENKELFIEKINNLERILSNYTHNIIITEEEDLEYFKV